LWRERERPKKDAEIWLSLLVAKLSVKPTMCLNEYLHSIVEANISSALHRQRCPFCSHISSGKALKRSASSEFPRVFPESLHPQRRSKTCLCPFSIYGLCKEGLGRKKATDCGILSGHPCPPSPIITTH